MNNRSAVSDVRVTPWWRQRWPWLLILGPAVVVVAGLVTAWLAVSGADQVIEDGHMKIGKAIVMPEKTVKPEGQAGR